ncbi:hypothetical protein EFM06_07905 [Lactobacillus helveticus]|uniref:hypothetical protein n=1 Tax=Lactobacillus helveticus TaxID=1587 RepID=UPI0021822B04|nr:hypothetical protein [Lactobacillus helveticus]MCT0197592.1 hypothetical protein [Lactobacillus helveticus]
MDFYFLQSVQLNFTISKRKRYSNQREFRIITKINDLENWDTIRIPIIKYLARSYDLNDLPRLAMGWKEKPMVTRILSECEKKISLM